MFLKYYIFSIFLYIVFTLAYSLNGRYTRDISDYELVIPRKLHQDGQFKTFQIPHFFEHKINKAKEVKRSIDKPHINYGITFNGAHHNLELWPNHNFLSPNAVFEKSSPKTKVQHKTITKTDENLCYYYGRLKDNPNSRVALSTCHGLNGYLLVDGKRYFIEPLANHTPNKRGQHLHVVHEGTPNFIKKMDCGGRCGTNSSHWETSWKNRFRREFTHDKNRHHFPLTKRTVKSVERYLECLVVADKKFLEYHKNTNHDDYILTVMNMVSDFYHDATIGHLLNVVVVRVMHLEKEEEEIDLIINANADETLASFCKWQQIINPKDVSHPNHHDIAILLTRYDICADALANCGLMGLAFMAAACTPDQPCAINEDNGLMLGVVIAHEVGHVMGCSHDIEHESGCNPQAEDKSYFVMSPYVHMHTNIWSTCSRTFVTEFFDNNLGECLNDPPEDSLYKETGMLPGVMYDANYQCNLEFPGSTECLTDEDTFCERLMCKTSPTQCSSNGEPPADGTKCAENMWCYNSKCIEMGERPLAVNGGWGTWGSWSKCSRDCAGGVSYSERECNNPVPQFKGRYCLGDRKRIKICNAQPCPPGSKGFRAEQCYEFDNKPFNEKMYKWEPHFVEEEPCVLYCINTDRVYSKLAARVKDGTDCKRGTRNMCIAGVCRIVGCDFVLDSEAVDDDCGICKGDGTQCKLWDQVYNGPSGHGYVKVVTIPKGSRNVYIEEVASSENIIAISGKDEKKFYLNGEFTEKQDGDYEIGGVEGVYSHPEPNKEELVIYGPLKEDIVLFVVFFNNENVGYHYKYAEPAAQSAYQPHYHWEFIEWAECSVRCGGGVEVASPECVEERDGKVSNCFCLATDKPDIKTRQCNEQPCKTKWRVGKWTECTACKFQSGVRTREVECVREAQESGKEDILVDDEKCPNEKPGTRELCNSCKTCGKTRRAVDNISPEIFQQVWFQTFDNYLRYAPVAFEDLLSNPGLVRRTRRSLIKTRVKHEKCNDGNRNGPNGGSHSNSGIGNGLGHAGGGESRGGHPGGDGHNGIIGGGHIGTIGIASGSSAQHKVDLKKGTIVDDRVDPEELKIIHEPIKHAHQALQLTDTAFQTMGDKVPDDLDSANAKVFTGKAAADVKKDLVHKNNTSGCETDTKR